MNINKSKEFKIFKKKLKFAKYYYQLYLCQLHLQNNFNMCIAYFIIFFKKSFHKHFHEF